jgi:hypothetical protein
MAMAPGRANSRTDAINDAFAAIGVTSTRATAKDAAALEYHWASHLLRIAETRRKKATADAIELGVIFDPIDAPEPVGANRVVFAGSVVEISVAVAAPMQGVDHAAFVADLLKAGVKPALIKRLGAKHAYQSRPAHKFSSSLLTR